jgi:hypothetical protein
MKLDAQMLKELIKEAVGPSMLLEEPVIAESSFNRIKDKIDKTNVRFVVMSADRHNFSRNENDQRYSELQAAFKANGFPFTKLEGAWTEKDDEGNEVRVVEKSLIVTEEDRGDIERGEKSLFELAKSLTEKYEQDAFIYGWVDETGERQIQARDQAGKYAGYGSWQSIVPVAEDAEFWSRVRGSTFVFKEEFAKSVSENQDSDFSDLEQKVIAYIKDNPEKLNQLNVDPREVDRSIYENEDFLRLAKMLNIPNIDFAKLTSQMLDKKINNIYKQYTDGYIGYEDARGDIELIAGDPAFKDEKQIIKTSLDALHSWAKARGDLDTEEEEFEPVFEVDAPNSVIEAMIKAEMHKGKKIKFVRRKK